MRCAACGRPWLDSPVGLFRHAKQVVEPLWLTRRVTEVPPGSARMRSHDTGGTPDPWNHAYSAWLLG